MKTITKIEYLKKCVKERKGFNKRDWFIKALSLPVLKDENEKGLEPYDLVIKSNGLHYLNENKELVKIVDHIKGIPLYIPSEPITINSETMQSVKKELTTTVGVLILNAVIVPKELESKIPYVIKPNSPAVMEKEITSRVINSNEKPKVDSIYITDMITMFNNLNFLSPLANLVITSSTSKTITEAPGSKKKLEELLVKYGDSIKDPVKLVELENELQAFDAEWLKDDPAYNNLFGRKEKDARFRMYGMIGKGMDFIKERDHDTVIKSSISDGVDTTPEEFAKYINDLRYGSYARGVNTAMGGYIHKVLQVSLGGVEIASEPCSTKVGLTKYMNDLEVGSSVGRSYKKGGSWTLISSSSEAESLKGTIVEMRSPMYCKSAGNSFCYACLNVSYKEFKNGASLMASEISNALLIMFMAMIHVTKTSITEIEVDDMIN